MTPPRLLAGLLARLEASFARAVGETRTGAGEQARGEFISSLIIEPDQAAGALGRRPLSRRLHD